MHFPSGSDVPRPWILFGNTHPNSLLFSADPPPIAIDHAMHGLVRLERIHQGLLHQGLIGLFLRRNKFPKPIQLACVAAGLGTDDNPIESNVIPSPMGPMFSYSVIDYKVVDITSGKLNPVKAN